MKGHNDRRGSWCRECLRQNNRKQTQRAQEQAQEECPARPCARPGCPNVLPAGTSPLKRYCDDPKCKKARQNDYSRSWYARKHAAAVATPVEAPAAAAETPASSPPPARVVPPPARVVQRSPATVGTPETGERTKECIRCGQTKSVDAFGPYEGTIDKLDFLCRDCRQLAEAKKATSTTTPPPPVKSRRRKSHSDRFYQRGVCSCGNAGDLYLIGPDHDAKLGCKKCLEAYEAQQAAAEVVEA